jgi:hypothetical protein
MDLDDETTTPGVSQVAVAARAESRPISSPRTITLLNLVSELVENSANESELVASVMDLVNHGGVRLVGQVVEPDLRNHRSDRLRVRRQAFTAIPSRSSHTPTR